MQRNVAVAALIVYSSLKVVVSDITRQVGNVIKSERAILNVEFQKTFIMAHAGLCGLDGDGHDEIRWISKTNFANNQKRTISESFINTVGNEVFVVLAISSICKNNTRWNGRVVRTTLKKKMPEYRHPSKRSEKFHLLWNSSVR